MFNRRCAVWSSPPSDPFPKEINPGALAHLADVSIDQRPAEGLRVNGGEMRFWHQFTEHLGGAAGIDEIVHHQPAAAIANNRGRLDDCGLIRLLRIVIVGPVADPTRLCRARATVGSVPTSAGRMPRSWIRPVAWLR